MVLPKRVFSAITATLFIISVIQWPWSQRSLLYSIVEDDDDRQGIADGNPHRLGATSLFSLNKNISSTVAFNPSHRSLATAEEEPEIFGSNEYNYSVLLISYHKTGVSLLEYLYY